ncbi:MAG: molybdenum cofactor guanylyltransferase [Verrucomicrobiaceae bacterium]|nr:molybdenum cofactor guanylyltransferase [Verrucomicrobiaceae bacterium]
MSYAAVLLCGGRSTRMGRDKALFEWHGQPLWALQIEKLGTLAPVRLLLSCREEQGIRHPAAECVYDPPGSDDGPLGAITRCLELVQMPLLVLAVDMPWMTADFLRERVLPGGFFRGEHGWEALCAVYEPRMLPVMQKALHQRHLALQPVIDACSPLAREMASEDRAFFRNANHPDDLAVPFLKPPMR